MKFYLKVFRQYADFSGRMSRREYGKMFVSLTLGLMFCGMLMSGCKKDDDEQSKIPKEILGEWKLKAVSIGALEATNEDVEDLLKEAFSEFSEDFDYGEHAEFNEDGTAVFHGEDVTFSVDKLTITMKDRYGDVLSFSYAVSNGNLTLTLNMRDILLENAEDELDAMSLAYLERTMKQFAFDITYQR